MPVAARRECEKRWQPCREKPGLGNRAGKLGCGKPFGGRTDGAGARRMVEETRALTDRPFNVNVFVHATPTPDPFSQLAMATPMYMMFEASLLVMRWFGKQDAKTS